MAQLLEDRDLALELLLEVLLRELRLVDDLDGVDVARGGVDALADFGEGARAENAAELVLAHAARAAVAAGASSDVGARGQIVVAIHGRCCSLR